MNKEHLLPSVQIFRHILTETNGFEAECGGRFRTATSGKQRERTLVKIILLHPRGMKKEKYGKRKDNSIFLQRMRI